MSCTPLKKWQLLQVWEWDEGGGVVDNVLHYRLSQNEGDFIGSDTNMSGMGLATNCNIRVSERILMFFGRDNFRAICLNVSYLSLDPFKYL